MKTTGSDPADVRGQPRRVLQGESSDRATLAAIARQAMIERSLEPDFPPAALQELAAIGGPAGATDDVRDLRDRLWASIDNDDSRDLDQLTVAESLAGERIGILVAVADVDALVRKGSAIDGHASHNTTSVYTPAAIFPMLLEALSTDLTSLNEDQDRIAVVADMVVEADGSLAASDLYRARVRNQGKLAYRGVAAWLEGEGTAPRRCEVIQAQLAKIGVKVHIELADAPTFRRRWLQERQWDLVQLQWDADLDPDETIYPELHSTEAWNAGKWVNKDFDRAVELARSENDGKKRKKYYGDAVKAILDDAPVAILLHVNEQKILHTSVKGFQMIPAGLINMHSVWLDRA